MGNFFLGNFLIIEFQGWKASRPTHHLTLNSPPARLTPSVRGLLAQHCWELKIEGSEARSPTLGSSHTAEAGLASR